MRFLFLLPCLLAGVWSQNVGTLSNEEALDLPIQICTATGCTTENDGVVLDANWRWTHLVSFNLLCRPIANSHRRRVRGGTGARAPPPPDFGAIG